MANQTGLPENARPRVGEDDLPRVQELQGDAVLHGAHAALQAAQVPAGQDAVQAAENALDQPREDSMQLLQWHGRSEQVLQGTCPPPSRACAQDLLPRLGQPW